MPPRCYPPDPDFGEDRRAERTVWQALRDQLPDDAALFHSVALKERGQDYEADLVVAWPGVGIAVIEVKGGAITREHGQWWQGDRAGRHRIDPVTQARDCQYVLHRFLREHANPAANARSAHLVAFPHTHVPRDWETAGCPRGLMIGSSELSAAAARTRGAVEVFGAGERALDAGALEALVTALAGELASQLSFFSTVAEHEQRVEQMTRDQLRVLRHLRFHTRLKVIGGAGTGKTWLAIEQARRLAADGQRVALVCYSRGLARYLERVTGEWPRRERPGYVGLFHELARAWGADPPPADPTDTGAQSEYYEATLPAQMGELAARLDGEKKFDAIVVDEAQDFGDAWWPPTLACLRNPQTGGLFAFLDEAQRVFNRHGEVPIPLPPYVLDENIRNTKRIAQVFGSLAGEQLVYRGTDGPPVRFVQCATDAALDAADDEVERLVDDGWPLGQIALLSTGHRHPEQVNEVDLGGWAGYWDEFFAATTVFYGHVLGFKGLERPAVVLAVNGIRDTDRAKEYLYVGLSRARTQLVVCGDLALIGSLGGESVRRRLAAAASG